MSFAYTRVLADYTAAFPSSAVTPLEVKNLDDGGYTISGESFTVPGSADGDGLYRVNLDQVPLEQSSVTITVGGNARTVVPINETPSAGQVALSTADGSLIFNVADAGATGAASYTGRGTPIMAHHLHLLQKEIAAVQTWLLGSGLTDIIEAGIDGVEAATFTLDKDNAGAGAANVTLAFNRGTDGADAQLRWNETGDTFEMALAGGGTMVDLQVADLTAGNAALTGTLTGMTNVTGSGDIVLATSPTLVTPTLGAATGTSLTLSGSLEIGNDTGTGSFVRATNPALNGTAQTRFTLDSDQAGSANSFLDLAFNRGATGDDALLRWSETNGRFELILDTSGTAQDLLAADATLASIAMTGTLTGMTNVTGSGDIVLATSPTLVTPAIGAATGTSLSLSGGLTALGAGDVGSLSIDGTQVIDDARVFTNVASLTASGDIGTSGDVGAGTTSPSRRLHAVIGAGTLPGESVPGATVAAFQNNDDDGDIALVSIVGGTAGNSILAFGDSGDENVGQIAYSHSDNSLSIRVNGLTSSLVIKNDSDVEIKGDRLFLSSSSIQWIVGSGSPEGAYTAPVGSLYSRTDGGASTTLYVKESGTGNTGWVAK